MGLSLKGVILDGNLQLMSDTPLELLTFGTWDHEFIELASDLPFDQLDKKE